MTDLQPHQVSEDKKLGPVLATVLVAGNMIGSGVYLLPATLAAVGSMSLVGWVICTAGALLLAGTFAGLATVRPSANGLVAYAEAALGRYFGFQTSLIYWISILIGVIAIAVAFTGYMASFLPALRQPISGAVCTVAIIWVFTVINIIGPKLMGKVRRGHPGARPAAGAGGGLPRLVLLRPGDLHRLLERLGQERADGGAGHTGLDLLVVHRGGKRHRRRLGGAQPEAQHPDRGDRRGGPGGGGLHPGHGGDQRHPAGLGPGLVERAVRRRGDQGGWARPPRPWSPSAPC